MVIGILYIVMAIAWMTFGVCSYNDRALGIQALRERLALAHIVIVNYFLLEGIVHLVK